jgi:hypothetical protein
MRSSLSLDASDDGCDARLAAVLLPTTSLVHEGGSLMRFRTLASGMFILVCAADASAQTCLGMPSFSDGPYQVAIGAAFTEGAQGVGGGGALGSDDIFVGATLAFTNVDAADSTVPSFGANVGATFVLSERERIEACPLASVSLSGGPDIGDLDVSGVSLRAGGRLGIVAAEVGNTEIVPNFGLDIAYDRLTGDLGEIETTIARETYVILRVGVGFILNKRLGFVPALGVPLGLEGGDPDFSFVVAYNFGGR